MSKTIPMLTAGAAAAFIAAFTLARRRKAQARRRAAIAERLRRDLTVGFDDAEPSQLDAEDLQWRPRIGSSLAGPEDVDPLELDFDELEETDVAGAAITVDLVGQGTEPGEVYDALGTDELGSEWLVRANEAQPHHGTGSGQRDPKHSDAGSAPKNPFPNTRKLLDDLDWLDELEEEGDRPPRRYR